jgi:hypothetical protein
MFCDGFNMLILNPLIASMHWLRKRSSYQYKTERIFTVLWKYKAPTIQELPEQSPPDSCTVTAMPVLFCGCECLSVTREQLSRTETWEVRCFGAVAGYIMADHKHNEDIGDNRYQCSYKNCRKEWIAHL